MQHELSGLSLFFYEQMDALIGGRDPIDYDSLKLHHDRPAPVEPPWEAFVQASTPNTDDLVVPSWRFETVKDAVESCRNGARVYARKSDHHWDGKATVRGAPSALARVTCTWWARPKRACGADGPFRVSAPAHSRVWCASTKLRALAGRVSWCAAIRGSSTLASSAHPARIPSCVPRMLESHCDGAASAAWAAARGKPLVPSSSWTRHGASSSSARWKILTTLTLVCASSKTAVDG